MLAENVAQLTPATFVSLFIRIERRTHLNVSLLFNANRKLMQRHHAFSSVSYLIRYRRSVQESHPLSVALLGSMYIILPLGHTIPPPPPPVLKKDLVEHVEWLCETGVQ